MQARRFGRTNHHSTVAIFGAAALWNASQAEADAAMEQVLAAGVNHIDVAPSYGLAEERLGHSCLASDLRHAFGASDVAKHRNDHARIAVFQRGIQIRHHVFISFEMLNRIPGLRLQLAFCHFTPQTWRASSSAIRMSRPCVLLSPPASRMITVEPRCT